MLNFSLSICCWFNSNSLVEGELVVALAQSLHGEAVVRNAVDGCRDLFLLQGGRIEGAVQSAT